VWKLVTVSAYNVLLFDISNRYQKCTTSLMNGDVCSIFTLKFLGLDVKGGGRSWSDSCQRSIVVKTLVSAGELSLSCARLLADHFVVKPSAIG